MTYEDTAKPGLIVNANAIGSSEPSRELKARARLTLMVTNESCHRLPAENGYMLYTVRWQIELIVKAWKSICGLSAIKMVKGPRVDCYIYGRLILILLAWNVLWPMIRHLYRLNGKPSSFYKATKFFVNRVRTLADILVHKDGRLMTFLSRLYNVISRVNILETRKGEPTYFSIIQSCVTSEDLVKSTT